MPVRSTPRAPSANLVPTLVPQGAHAGKSLVPITKPVVMIGSRYKLHLHLLSRSISKTHAVLIASDGGFYIRDLASRTHVFVNGKKVREATIAHGDFLQLGNF